MTTRQLLILQRNALVSALTPASEPWAKVRAKALIARIDRRLAMSDAALENSRGLYGENGWQPEVDDAVRLLLFRPAPSIHLSEDPRTNAETQTRRAA